jgi:hypothetical protein
MKHKMALVLLDEKICFIRLPPDTLQNFWLELAGLDFNYNVTTSWSLMSGWNHNVMIKAGQYGKKLQNIISWVLAQGDDSWRQQWILIIHPFQRPYSA